VAADFHAGEEWAEVLTDAGGAVGGAIVHDGEWVILEGTGGDGLEGAAKGFFPVVGQQEDVQEALRGWMGAGHDGKGNEGNLREETQIPNGGWKKAEKARKCVFCANLRLYAGGPGRNCWVKELI
jgi:hypothetical protein